MPIHLGPITRRDFLAGATGAAAALLLGGRAGAADKLKVDPHCFALLSDTHVPADPKKTQARVNMTDNFAKAISQVAGLETAPAGAILCGDLAHKSGLPEEYSRFAPMLRKLTRTKLPTHLLLGNHDHIGNIYKALAESKPAKPLVVGKHVSIVQSPRANWFLLDSLEVVNAAPGLLGKKQLAWLEKALDAHTDKPAIVMAHHDPWIPPAGKPNLKPRRMSGLKDGQAMLDLLVGRKHVKAFIHGHRHHWFPRTYKGLQVVGLPAVAYVSRKTESSAWVLARLEDKGCSLELRCLNTKHATHGKKVELTWRS
ncbi:MAG: metallophosphoesterase [Phycisphaerae bacterium]|jgi:3',5'-cyclic AMP phosphodiesterase CpdA|nr:metallophosphoesterase [Phycisphaerae bacterium]